MQPTSLKDMKRAKWWVDRPNPILALALAWLFPVCSPEDLGLSKPAEQRYDLWHSRQSAHLAPFTPCRRGHIGRSTQLNNKGIAKEVLFPSKGENTVASMPSSFSNPRRFTTRPRFSLLGPPISIMKLEHTRRPDPCCDIL